MDTQLPSCCDVLRTSAVLQAALPEVRKKAIIETMRDATPEKAIQILIENIVHTPATESRIPMALKSRLVELMLLHRWAEVKQALQCQEATVPEVKQCQEDRRVDPDDGQSYTLSEFIDKYEGVYSEAEAKSYFLHHCAAESPATTDAEVHEPLSRFEEFRSMVVAVYSCSRKMASLTEARRRELGFAIYSTSTVEELMLLCLRSLEHSTMFLGQARERVANDMLDHRHDLLLLPDRFDCAESPLFPIPPSGVAVEECPVCLSSNVADTELPCRHKLCSTCTDLWRAKCGGVEFSCPVCRAPTDSWHATA